MSVLRGDALAQADPEARDVLLERAQKGGLNWVVVAYIWPELNGCECQGQRSNGESCVELRVRQVETLFSH